MSNYVTTADMQVWCEKTIEEAPLSSCKTAGEHLLAHNKALVAELARLKEVIRLAEDGRREQR